MINHLKGGKLLVLLLAGLVVACQADKPQEPETPSIDTPKQVTVPAFQRDSAYRFVEKQVEFGPRVPNSAAHAACLEWLAGKLERYGAEVQLQSFKATAYNGDVLNGTNIIGKFNPQNQSRILLAAHWDSRHIADSPLSTERVDEPIPGADDGASGVGVLIEIARQISENPIQLGVDIVFFDAEDYGEDNGNNPESWALGAQQFSRNLPYTPNNKPKYGILLDMVGASGARFAKEEVSRRAAPGLLNNVWKLAQAMGYGNYFVNDPVGGVTDDHYFVNTIARIPMIDIINKPIETETGFVAHWHTQNDDMDAIDARTLRAAGQVVLAVVYREDAGTFGGLN